MVPLGDVANLMGQHPGEFRLGIEIGQQPAVDVYQPARQGKGIDVR